MSVSASRLAVLFGSVAAVTLTGTVSSCTRVTDRDIAIKTRHGKVIEEISEPGLYFRVPFITKIHKYPTYRQNTTIGENDANLRTQDNQQITGEITIEYAIRRGENMASIYKDFNNNYEDILLKRARTASVTVLGQESSIDLTHNLGKITEKIKTHLQDSLDKEGLPFNITHVNSSGIGLSPESNQKLEALMLEEQRARVLQMREANAEKEQAAVAKEAQVIAKFVEVLRKEGVPEDQIPTMLCLQQTERAGRINEPFSSGCFPNTGKSFVPAVTPR